MPGLARSKEKRQAMGIVITPYTSELESAVKAFNARLRLPTRR